MSSSSREKLQKTLNHEEPEEVVVDLGSSLVSGIAAGALSRLRETLGLEKRKVKVYEPFQVLGKVEEDVRKALGIDVVGLASPYTFFGYKNENWKPWELQDGTEVLVGEGFETKVGQDGAVYIYPQGDRSVPPSGKMPEGGYYFDNIVRGEDDTAAGELNPREDFKDDFQVLSEEELKEIEKSADHYYEETDYGINLGNFVCSLGDFALLSGPAVKNPTGIRSIEKWMMAHYTHSDYVNEVYDFQLEIALQNLKLLKEAVGDRAATIQISGTDFGTQEGEMISPDLFREFYKPRHKRLNDWVHENTNWKTFYHCCGSIANLLDDFVEAGADVLNPVQCSAAGMDPKKLKEEYGAELVFWGGGIDTQKTLPFGTPEEVKEETRERLEIFAPGGGFVFNTIHNIQAPTPVENILALFRAIEEYDRS